MPDVETPMAALRGSVKRLTRRWRLTEQAGGGFVELEERSGRRHIQTKEAADPQVWLNDAVHPFS